MSDTPYLDAQVLLAHIVGKKKAWVMAHPELELTSAQKDALRKAMARLESGEPLPYVLGHWEFYGLDFWVTSATLIPRPETEVLVDQALAWLDAHPSSRLAVDVGTGTGCISVVLACKVPNLQVVACDVSLDALQVARQNVYKHGVGERVHCVQSHLIPPLSCRFPLICANLPYIPSAVLHKLKVAREEPLLALNGGSDGLSLIKALVKIAPNWLLPGGMLLLEIEESQGGAVVDLASEVFPGACVELISDLAGRERILKVER